MIDQHMTTSLFRKLEEGAVLFHENDDSDYIYYLQKGCLEAFTNLNGKREILGKINTDEFVGELGVLQNTKRNASVMALEETHITQYNQAAFLEIIAKDPEKSIRLIHSLSYRAQNVALLSAQIAKQITEHKPALSLNPVNVALSLASRSLKYIKSLIHRRQNVCYKKLLLERLGNGIHHIKKGSVLLGEGRENYYACRVINGKFKALKSIHHDYEIIGFINSGEYIGEIGLLAGAPHILSVLAVEDSKIEVFDEDTFMQTICIDTQNCFELIAHLSSRAGKLNQHLKELTVKYADILNPSTVIQAKQLLQNIGDVSLLTGQMIEQDLAKLKMALRREMGAVQGMIETYYRYIAGKADKHEMERANAEFRNFLKTLGLGALIIIPGSFITIPLIVKIAKSKGIDVLPKSRSD